MAKSFARLSPFARGKIVGKASEGAPAGRIRKQVRKKDGKMCSARAIRSLVKKAREDPSYDGIDSSAGGRPQEFSSDEKRKLKKLIQDEVGLAKVTVPYCIALFFRSLREEASRQEREPTRRRETRCCRLASLPPCLDSVIVMCLRAIQVKNVYLS